MKRAILLSFLVVATTAQCLAAGFGTKDKLKVLFDSCRSDLDRPGRGYARSPAKAALDSALKAFLSRVAASQHCGETALLRDSLPDGIALTLSAPEASWGATLAKAEDTSHAVSIRGYRAYPFCAYIIGYRVAGRTMVATAPLVLYHANGPVLVSDESQLWGHTFPDDTMWELWHCFGIIAHSKDSALVLVTGPSGSGQFSFLYLCRKRDASLQFVETNHEWPGLNELRNTGKTLVADCVFQDRTEPDEAKSIKGFHETLTAKELFNER